MIKWLLNWMDKGKSLDVRATGFVADSWNAACGFRAYDFRDQLDEVAKALGPNIRTRFNPRDHCAELYDEFGLFASINVSGEVGSPERMEITSSKWIPPTAIFHLQKILPTLHVSFKGASNDSVQPPHRGLYGQSQK